MSALSELVEAVRNLDEERVDEILSSSPSLACEPIVANIADGVGKTQTLLHLAMPGDGRRLDARHEGIVGLLLDAGADVNALGHGPNHGECTALSLAAWGGHTPLVELLLERGAFPDGANETLPSHRPVSTAARHGHGETVDLLLDRGATFVFEDLLFAGLKRRVAAYLDDHPDALSRILPGGASPLHAALTTSAGAELVPFLVQRGVDVSRCDDQGRTALHLALEGGHRGVLDVLSEPTRGPLDLFAAAGLPDVDAVARLLREDSAKARQVQADGVTPLFYAALSGVVESARSLLDAGADPSPQSFRFWACLTPLHLCLQRRHTDLATFLLRRGAAVDACGETADRYFPTPLHTAARWAGLDLVRQLLEGGADPNNNGETDRVPENGVLYWVSYAGQIDILKLLLDRGLDLGKSSTNLALHIATAQGHEGFIRILLENGADPTSRNEEGLTARDLAEAHGRSEIVELLARY